jgi:hypothetical protein
MMKRICAVIVNYKTAELTRDCIDSLLPQLDVRYDCIVVVDNASGIGELELLTGYLASQCESGLVKIIALPQNAGFSAGNNAGIASCEAEYYLLTNSDTVFLPGAVSGLVTGASTFPSGGLISPRLEYPDGEPQVSCFRFHSPVSETIRSANTGIITRILKSFNVPLLPSSSPSHPEWTSFACVLIRKAVIDSIGLLDDGFFMYYEDEDYCYRCREAGFDIVNWPSARVIHLQGKSSDVGKRVVERKMLPDYYYHSRSRYYHKHYGYPGFILANAFWYLGRLISLIRQTLQKIERPVPSNEFLNIWKHSDS